MTGRGRAEPLADAVGIHRLVSTCAQQLFDSPIHIFARDYIFADYN